MCMNLLIGLKMLLKRLFNEKKGTLDSSSDHKINNKNKDKITPTTLFERDVQANRDFFASNKTSLNYGNVFPLKPNKLANEQDEKKRVQDISKQIANNFVKTAEAAGCPEFWSWYCLLFYVQQRMVFNINYLDYRSNVESVEKQVIRNYKKYTFKECPELSEDNIGITKEKKNEKEKTIH